MQNAIRDERITRSDDIQGDPSLYEKMPCERCMLSYEGDGWWHSGQCLAYNTDNNAAMPSFKPDSVYDGECRFFRSK